MGLALFYSAHSTACRKIRLAMDYKQLVFAAIEQEDWSFGDGEDGAVLPKLVHDDIEVEDLADISGYLDRCYPELPLYPPQPRLALEVRRWERLSDTLLDAIIGVVGAWTRFDLPPMPADLPGSARRDIDALLDRMQQKLAVSEFMAGVVGVADFAAYPRLAFGAEIGLEPDAHRHADVLRWMSAIRHRPEGRIDLAALEDARRGEAAQIGPGKAHVRWGAFHLQWLVVHGYADWLGEQLRAGEVEWCTRHDVRRLAP